LGPGEERVPVSFSAIRIQNDGTVQCNPHYLRIKVSKYTREIVTSESVDISDAILLAATDTPTAVTAAVLGRKRKKRKKKKGVVCQR